MFMVFVLTLTAVLPASSARAEYFVWQDRLSEVSLSYPDRWAAIHTQKPDEVIQIAAPGDGDYASCRMRVRDDGRFKIHPPQLAGSVQRLNVSQDFWNAYVGEFDQGKLLSVTDNAGLGRGFASWAEMVYIADAGPRVQKRSFAYATIHYDKMFIFECSSELSVYDQWHKPFLGILKSVDFAPTYSQYLNGHYRNFPADSDLLIRGRKRTDDFIY
jgi:hypothetical protein